jgi:hypothetical protein
MSYRQGRPSKQSSITTGFLPSGASCAVANNADDVKSKLVRVGASVGGFNAPLEARLS